MQAVPTPAELVVHAEDIEDAVSEDFDSPTPRITHRYPDRVLFVVTEMCSMYCRHCTRRRLVGGTEDIVAQTEIDNAIKYIERSPEVRDVLHQRRRPAGPVATSSSESILAARARHRPRGDHPHRLARAGRLPAAHHARAGARCSSKYQPLYFNTHFNHPQEFTAESELGLRPAQRRRHPDGQPDGAHARHQRLRQRHEEALPQAAAVPRQALLLLPVRPGRRARPTSAPASPRASRSTRACAATPPASACRPTSSTPSAAAGRRR